MSAPAICGACRFYGCVVPGGGSTGGARCHLLCRRAHATQRLDDGRIQRRLRILAEEGGQPPVVGPDILLPEVAHLKFDHLAMSLAAYTAST